MSSSDSTTKAERETLGGFRSGAAMRPRGGDGDDAWTGFGLRCQLEACRLLRESAGRSGGRADLKHDGSPATRLEHEVEEGIRARLSQFDPEAVFVGEESGGGLPDTGLAVAVDPVDGTWAFLTETSTWASTLAVFRDGVAIAGFIANPMTGELAYASAGSGARYLRLSTFGDDDVALDLPGPTSRDDKLLVNFHPSRGAGAVQRDLHDAWERSELSMVRSPGGSPAWCLLEAARGHYVYVNMWGQRPAEPFDLAAGVLLVRGAGGDVTDLDGAPIDPGRHAGPWIAGIDAERRESVTAIVRGAQGL
jgi:myo-inositol-1(or 4)-monophosphatase